MKKVFFSILFILYSVGLIGQIDTEFWFAAPEVSPVYDNFNIPIVFRISSLDKAAEVVIDQPSNPGFVPVTLNIAANSTQSVDLSSFIDQVENKPANEILNNGIRIISTEKVGVYYEVVSSYCLCNPEIFTLKGRNALGIDFFVPFQSILNNSNYYNPAPYSAFDIVATEDNTSVLIRPTNDIVGHSAGIEFQVILNKGQSYSARASSQLAGLHLHGSTVRSDKPIAITIKDDLLDGTIYGGCADLAGDQIVPVSRTGKEYVVVKGFLNGPDRVFIVGTADNTQVTIAGNNSGIVNAGQTLVYDLNEPSVYIESTENIYVLQLSGFGCEVGCGLIPSVSCTGSRQVGFTRSLPESFKLMLMVQSGGEDDFILNGNASIIQASDFADVPFTDGKWKVTTKDLSITEVPVDQSCLISNNSTRFHLGIIHGSSTGGCRFGYFSDFAFLESTISSNGTEFCEGEALSLNASELTDVLFEWSGPDGFSAQEASTGIPYLSTDNSGYYILNGSDGACPVIPDSIYITVHPLPADLGEPITQYVDLVTGLVASYPFNGNSEDETGNGNNGSVIGNVVLTSDRYGNTNSAYEFPGLAFNYISVPHSSYLELNTFTISAWIFTETDYGYGQVVQKNRDIVSGHYGLYTSQFGGTVSYGVGVGTGVSVDPAIGEWHMITGTLSGNFAAFYTDGQLLTDTIAPNSYQYSGTDPMAIGMHYYEGVPDYWTYPYKGKIDDILIYNRVLSPEEIQCLYTGDCQQLVLSATQGETTLCRGGTSSITLFNAQAGVSYQVKDNEQHVGLPQTGNADTLMFNLPDIFADKAFTILATDTATGCSRVLDSVFRVNVVPVVAEIEASLSSTFAPAMASLSSVSQEADSWTWLVNGEVVAATEQTQLELTQPGEYEIVLQVISSQPWQCTDADTTLLSLQEQIIVLFEFPPAFSPNGDGYNDVFVPAAEGVDAYSVVVKDAWGRTMAEFDRSSSGWKGNTTGGAEAPAGAYYYLANATDYNGISLDRSGVVYLIRDLIDLTPNPVAAQLVVSMNGRLPGRKHLRILQVSGKEIYSTDFEGESLTLDTSWLDKAMYIMQISNDTNVVNVKFVKE